MKRFVLDDHRNPVPEPDLERWAEAFGRDRRVALSSLAKGGSVSTVFLGLDHSFGNGPPLLFETMAFDQSGSEMDTERTPTWDDAEAAHARMVAAQGGALQ